MYICFVFSYIEHVSQVLLQNFYKHLRNWFLKFYKEKGVIAIKQVLVIVPKKGLYLGYRTLQALKAEVSALWIFFFLNSLSSIILPWFSF